MTASLKQIVPTRCPKTTQYGGGNYLWLQKRYCKQLRATIFGLLLLTSDTGKLDRNAQLGLQWPRKDTLHLFSNRARQIDNTGRWVLIFGIPKR